MTDQQTDNTVTSTPAPRKRSFFHRLRLMLKWPYRVSLTLLLLVTAYVTGGRLLIHLVATQQDAVESRLSAVLGTPVSISTLEGGWFRFSPVINIRDLGIYNAENPEASHLVPNLSIRLDVANSLLRRQLVIEQVILHEPGLGLRETETGSWTLAGLAGGGADYTDAIIDFLLGTGRLSIVEADLFLQWQDGRRLDLDNIYIDLANGDNQHRAQVQARIAGQPSPFQMQLAFSGDPRDKAFGDAYLHSTQLGLADLVSLPGLDLEQLEASADVWVSLQESGELAIQAAVSRMSILGQGQEDTLIDAITLENASALLSARHAPGQAWQVWLDDAEFDWASRPWSADELFAEIDPDIAAKPLSLMAAGIDLAMVNDVVEDLLRLPARGEEALADLSPAGSLDNVRFTTNLDGSFEDAFLLQGNLRHAAVGAWAGAPAGSGIDGYLEVSKSKGMVELASTDFGIHLPRIFDDAWQYDSARSQVNWEINDSLVHVWSSIIDVQNDFLHSHVQFDLSNTRNSTGETETDLTLLIGILDFDASQKSLYLPTLEKVRGTMDWLDEALLDGHITNSGFVSRTRLSPGATENDSTMLTFYNVSEGELKFLPDWPAVSGIDASVVVDNRDVDISAAAGMIEGIPLKDTVAAIRPAENGSLLSLTGNADTSTASGMAFLRNTPVRDNIGDFIDNWQGEGSVHVDLALGIPLGNPGSENDIRVDVVSNRSTLTIPEYSLSIADLRGRVNFQSGKGLSASALSGKLFDFPIAATIEAYNEETGDGDYISGTRIVGSGRASRNALQTWEGQPQFVRDVLNFASGEVDYLAEINIPSASGSGENGTSLRVTSELLGLAIDMPYPFAKTVEQIRPLVLLINFADSEEWISTRFDNRIAANLRIMDGEFAGGRVTLGPGMQAMTFGPVDLMEPGLVFNGYIDRYDYEAWDQAALRFSEQSVGEGASMAGLITLVDVDVGRLSVVGQELEEVRTQVRRSSMSLDEVDAVADGWLVSLENGILKGDFLFPDDLVQPWRIDLDYLHLPDDEEDKEDEAVDSDEPPAEEVDVLAEVIPSELPDMDFSTDEFMLGTKNFGAWEFQLRTNGDAASISNLHMTTPDARIRDFSDQSGANMNWRFSNGMHTTSFAGLFHAADLAEVLPGWGYDANVESEEASFISNLQWSGSPAAFSLDKAVGNVVLNIRDGRFVDIDSGGSRLFGAFSFDSLVRRLQLDFSDLYEKGLAYDDINGRLQFNQGIVKTDGPFRIDGPSSQISINGEINLLRETIDADMQVNVPLSQNLSVLAGLLGAWPIALSTFIASKIFEDQVDDFTTLLYRLEGPWEDPTSGFEASDELLEVSQEALEEAQASAAARQDAPASGSTAESENTTP